MKRLSFLILLSLSLNGLISQETTDSKVQSTEDSQADFYEKVYLHTDRNSYLTGEIIWFKAYLVESNSNQLNDHSNNLYVELISANGDIVQERIIRLDDGLGNGDFDLGDSIPSGQYLIRAYTNWMRNFNDEFFYEKEIIVADAHLKEAISPKNDLVSDGKIDIQFFPEGGSLVTNVSSIVGFKSVDKSGLGCFVKGFIISSFGDTVSRFESTHLGMDKFRLTPKNKQKYYAIGKTKSGQHFKTELPNSFSSGICMEVIFEDQEHLLITLKTNKETLPSLINHNFSVKGSSKNVVYLTADVKINSLLQKFRIPTNYFPEGITRLSLVDETKQAYCERLVYLNNNPDLMVNIIPDKNSYTPRTATSLNISVSDFMGEDVASNLSLSVYDKSANYNGDPYPSDIASYFLLESEINGYVEQAGAYFDYSNPYRKRDMELLLLTQGWRDFKWKYISDSSYSIVYPAENGFNVSGKLTRVTSNKPISNTNISLGIYNDFTVYCFADTMTNTSGNFRFKNLNYVGKNYIVVSANDSENNKKRKLLIDSIANTYPTINHTFASNDPSYNKFTELKKIALTRDSIYEKYKLDDVIMLDEVTIKAKRIKQVKARNKIIQVTEKEEIHKNVFDLLKGQVLGLTISQNKGEYVLRMRNAPKFANLRIPPHPLLLLDGLPTDIGQLKLLPVQKIEKIEVLSSISSTSIYGGRGSYGVISIKTRKNGSRQKYIRPALNTITKSIQGYNSPRVFYKPKYNVETSKRKPDLRTTIHWDPNIKTSNEATKNVKFWNSYKVATIEIKLEGLSEGGIPISNKAQYKVEW